MEIVSLAAVEQVNQGIERRESADPALVLILGDLVEEAGGVARGQPIHKKPILGFDPFEKVVGDRVAIAELPPHVGQIDAGDETDSPRFLFRQLPQSTEKGSDGRRLFRRRSVDHHGVKRGDQNRHDLKRFLLLSRERGAPLGGVLQEQDPEFKGMLAAMEILVGEQILVALFLQP